jgi:hypothetical protein
MDNDSFLRACEIGSRYYAISGLAAPISLRDQMIRAYVLACRLPTYLLCTPGEPVLVEGAGAAGVTFALTVAGRLEREDKPCPDIWLIESGPAVFSLQADVHTRWIDPTQYD